MRRMRLLAKTEAEKRAERTNEEEQSRSSKSYLTSNNVRNLERASGDQVNEAATEPDDCETSPSPEPTGRLRRGRGNRSGIRAKVSSMSLQQQITAPRRPARMTLLPPRSRQAGMSLLPLACVSSQLRKESNSPESASGSFSGANPLRRRCVHPARARRGFQSRYTPRTRVLITPERALLLPTRRVLRTSERVIATGKPLLRTTPKKYKHMRNARRQPRAFVIPRNEDSSETSSIDSNILESSGSNTADSDSSSADEQPIYIAQRIRLSINNHY